MWVDVGSKVGILLRSGIQTILLRVMELRHLFAVSIVFVGQLGSKVKPHVVSSVFSQSLRVLICLYQPLHVFAFFTTNNKSARLETRGCYLHLVLLVFIVYQFAPLVESIKF